jgi:cytochrome c biogenesis protein CcmG, thiol:disulfide interchange protein DsbE
MRCWAGLAMLAIVPAACGRSDAAVPKPAEAYRAPQVGDAAPAFAVATIGGDSARVGGSATQPLTLVNIWATWCGPCKAEFPELQALHTNFGPRGLRVLAVSIDTEADSVVAASAEGMGATFAIGRDRDDTLRGQIGAVGIPESWLVSTDGTLLWRHSGAIPAGDASVRAAISTALSAATR